MKPTDIDASAPVRDAFTITSMEGDEVEYAEIGYVCLACGAEDSFYAKFDGWKPGEEFHGDIRGNFDRPSPRRGHEWDGGPEECLCEDFRVLYVRKIESRDYAYTP